MRIIIICVVTMLCMSCHTSKRTTTDIAVETNTESAEKQEVFVSLLDSLRMTLDFTADSIVISTPKVIKVNNRDSLINSTISFIKPYINKQQEQVSKNTTNSSLDIKTYTSKDSTAQVKENTEKVVVANPFNWWWVIGFCILLFVGWIGIRWMRKQIDLI